MAKKDKNKSSKTHEDLKGFEIHINAFGEIETNLNVERINSFLNDHVDDKKLNDKDSSENTIDRLGDT